ncbi:MAG: hypothetical protein QW594_03865 [Candidatus Woesearchaeota archaeon]
MSLTENLQTLMKALEAGNYNVAPSQLTQGAALQTEDLSPVMHEVTYSNKHFKLLNLLPVKSVKSQLFQFNRKLSYGDFGGSAQFEGSVGREDTSDFVRVVIPMAYYSNVRRVTLAAQQVATFHGESMEEEAAKDAAMKIAGDIEFDLVFGQAHFSNAGVFDGNVAAMPDLIPNLRGIDAQVRASDAQANAQDLMFAEFGSDISVVLPVDGVLTQSAIEDAAVRASFGFSSADLLLVDPAALAEYNKIAFQRERIMLAGSPQESTGATLSQQWTSLGPIAIQSSQFLRAKTAPARAKATSPAAPAAPTAAALLAAGSKLLAGNYIYFVTAVNINGESVASPTAIHTVASDGDAVQLTIAPVSGALYYNVYRSETDGSLKTAAFIGRVKQGSGPAVFIDMGNRAPMHTSAYLIEQKSMQIGELMPYSRIKLAVHDLSMPEAHARFLSLAVMQPRKNVILDNIKGALRKK